MNIFSYSPRWYNYWSWLVVALVMVSTLVAVWITAPIQIPVIVYKLHLVCLGVLVGYIANEMFLKIEDDIAQVLIIFACIVGLTHGL